MTRHPQVEPVTMPNDKTHAKWLRKEIVNGRVCWFCDLCGKQLTGPRIATMTGNGRRGK